MDGLLLLNGASMGLELPRLVSNAPQWKHQRAVGSEMELMEHQPQIAAAKAPFSRCSKRTPKQQAPKTLTDPKAPILDTNPRGIATSPPSLWYAW